MKLNIREVLELSAELGIPKVEAAKLIIDKLNKEEGKDYSFLLEAPSLKEPEPFFMYGTGGTGTFTLAGPSYQTSVKAVPEKTVKIPTPPCEKKPISLHIEAAPVVIRHKGEKWANLRGLMREILHRDFNTSIPAFKGFMLATGLVMKLGSQYYLPSYMYEDYGSTAESVFRVKRVQEEWDKLKESLGEKWRETLEAIARRNKTPFHFYTLSNMTKEHFPHYGSKYSRDFILVILDLLNVVRIDNRTKTPDITPGRNYHRNLIGFTNEDGAKRRPVVMKKGVVKDLFTEIICKDDSLKEICKELLKGSIFE